MNDGVFKRELCALIPRLRGHALALTNSGAAADDLIQDALVRAWRFRASYRPGTNFSAWLHRILRNTFYTSQTAQRMLVQDVDGAHAAKLSCDPEQQHRLDYEDLLSALQLLTPQARDALLLVAASLTYEEAAELAGCPVGTMKSRVHRAREHLAELLDAQGAMGADSDRRPPPGRQPRRPVISVAGRVAARDERQAAQLDLS